jgi:hypothetical protein
MLIEPENNNVSIVLIGSLNAAIFHPSWFVANNILRKDDIEDAKVDFVHSALAVFKIGDWLSVRVEQNRFIAETSEPPFIRINDFVVKTFKEVLVHTPLFQIGINRQVHFSVGDEETRNKIGKKLAPQEAWGEWASDIAGKKDNKHGGMMSLTMQQADLDDRSVGAIQARVEPSMLIKNRTGIFVGVNDHYEIAEQGHSGGSAEIMDILVKQFDASIKRSEWIIDQVMNLKDKV